MCAIAEYGGNSLMTSYYHHYYLITQDQFAALRPAMQFRVVQTKEDSDAHFAHELAALIRANNEQGQKTKVILPVGPLDYRPFAELCNQQRLSCRDLFVFMMDEYCNDDGSIVPRDHPLSFHAFMDRQFIQLIDEDLRPPPDQIVFPDPQDPQATGRLMLELGGIDVCYGGFGINGHFAFNDPPEPGEQADIKSIRHSTTRLVSISRETITQTAMGGTGGNLELALRRAVTLGMQELLSAREIHLYFMRTWHAAVMRRALLGPVTPAFPASFVQQHPKVEVTMTAYVAALPMLKVTQAIGT